MTLSSLLKSTTRYNHWANSQMVQWLQSKPAELLLQEIPSSFPTLKDTMVHIWGAEEIWLERLSEVPTSPFLSLRFQGSLEEVFEGWVKKSGEFAAFVESLDDAALDHICPFKLLNGTEDARPRHYMIHHCMNHSTYHRGQIVTMARSLGLTDPPSTDYIKYVRIV